IIRGAVMILMAIDHVRVYAAIPAGGPYWDIFFTRWVTHFCAPAFIFLAGTSAFLYARKHSDISKFLLTRGAWLVFLELTFLRVAWTFNFDFTQYEMAGVIWVIGWSMILMAGLVKLPLKIVAAFVVMIIFGHNLLDSYLWTLVPTLGDDVGSALWKIAYVGFFAGPISAGPEGPNLIVLYSLVPWVGVMAAGYAFGNILTFESEQRNRVCLRIGLGAIALFVMLRGFNLYGDFQPWSIPSDGPDGSKMPALLSFLNTTKYPASLLFLLMTLGPTIAVIPVLEKARGVITDAIALFGRVPFFYYMLHIPLIHALALVISYISNGEVSDWLFMNHPMGVGPAPEGYRWSLTTMYFVWAITIVILYYLCRWFAKVKATRTEWWLKYL
ncbi:MAG: heparan-alpha-glucosaminide N-acetyltransferase domain-containing protein, partial [Anaerolineae bacterium]|nr:heparan-alpha-glucosaminide N-acetyltransferase domain-containing protein [Anaerolineae bacterium]